MTTWFIVMLFLFGGLKILVSGLPTSVVESFISRFELHPQLNGEAVTVTIDGNRLEGADKLQIIDYFNEAIFLEKYYFPPQHDGIPLVIETKRGKYDVRFSIYSFDDHVDVIKQYKKKVIAYSLRSKTLQNRSMLVVGDVV